MSEALERLAAILERGGDPDDVLRDAVGALAAEPGIQWAGVAFLEERSLVLGPAAGTPNEELRARLPVAYEDATVGELWVDGVADQTLLERVVTLLSPYVLIGWDTQGEAWEP